MGYPANHLWGNASPICPYCSTEYDASDSCANDDQESELECQNCNKIFFCRTRMVAEYSTVGSCEKNKQMPHLLKKTWPDEINQYVCTKCNYEW